MSQDLRRAIATLEANLREKTAEVNRLFEDARACGEERAGLLVRVEAADSTGKVASAHLAASEARVKELIVSWMCTCRN